MATQSDPILFLNCKFDVKVAFVIVSTERKEVSETDYSLNRSLPEQAGLVTARSEAFGTMEPFAKGGKAARSSQRLPVSRGQGARLDGKANSGELLQTSL